MDNLRGIYPILRKSPWWLTLGILYSTTIGVLPVGRWLLEGMAYNVSLSSQWGDLALAACVVLGVGALKRASVHVPWMERWTTQGACVCIAMVAGGYAQWQSMADHGGRFGEVMDAYHNMFVLPLYLFLLLTTGPVLWYVGTRTERAGAICLVLVWAVLVVYDARTGRLDQQAWLIEQGMGSVPVRSGTEGA